MQYFLVAIMAYLIGSVNFSILISEKMAGIDIREKGSGNAGTTNMLRTLGKKAAFMTLVCDVLKGVVAVLLAILVGKMCGDSENIKSILAQIAAIGVVVGHTYPIFFGFKGGKGVATSLGILLIMNWQLGVICLIFALAMMAITRMVSFGSVSAAVLFPILTLFVGQGHYIVNVQNAGIGNGYFLFSLTLAIIVAFNHRTNIKRIIKGNENKVSFKKN